MCEHNRFSVLTDLYWAEEFLPSYRHSTTSSKQFFVRLYSPVARKRWRVTRPTSQPLKNFQVSSFPVEAQNPKILKQVFSPTGPPRRVDCLAQWKISVKCFSQGHNDEMPDSSIEPTTFRLPAGALPTELHRRRSG